MVLGITNAILILIIIYITGKYIHHLWNIKSFPPSPFPLPITGNLRVVLKEPLHIVIVNTIDPTIETLI